MTKFMTTKTHVGQAIILIILIAVISMLTSPPVVAAPIRVDFTANITLAQGVYAGASGAAVGTVVYDDNAIDQDPGPLGSYPAVGAPFQFQATLPVGPSFDFSISVLTVDNQVTTTQDIVQLQGDIFELPSTFLIPFLDFRGDPTTLGSQDIPTINQILSFATKQFFIFETDGGTGGLVLAADITSLNIAPVPLPPAIWLFGSGLLGLIGIARKKKAA